MQNRSQCSVPGQGQTPSLKPLREMSAQEARIWLESLQTRLTAKMQQECAPDEQDQLLANELMMLIHTLLQKSVEQDGGEIMSQSSHELSTWSAWYVALHRRLHCAWCWQALHIQRWFPEQWTSSLCPYHQRWLHQHLMQRHPQYIQGSTSVSVSLQE